MPEARPPPSYQHQPGGGGVGAARIAQVMFEPAFPTLVGAGG
jgi:hypothetical protein